jgi:hypothetical protein
MYSSRYISCGDALIQVYVIWRCSHPGIGHLEMFSSRYVLSGDVLIQVFEMIVE